ncbi:MAG: hypothetical protein J1F64_06395 [Oscillospiraceae bacterium]|nr:hypothetical protein [Oscillospiraceae bacterium]
MKKIVLIAAALLAALSVSSCDDAELERLRSENSSLSEKIRQEQAGKRDNTQTNSNNGIVNIHEFEEFPSTIKYNDTEYEALGYLIDDASYVFRLDDIANQLGLNVSIDETGSIAISGTVKPNSSDSSTNHSSANTSSILSNITDIPVDDRYTAAGIMNLIKSGDISVIEPTDEPKTIRTAPSGSAGTSSSSPDSASAAGAPRTPSSSTPEPTPVNKDYPFNFSSVPSSDIFLNAREKNDTTILENFGLYHEVASRFYSRFTEVPNLKWAEPSVSAVQISNRKENATYWYYVPDMAKERLESAYVTILSEFGYEYAGSLNDHHTYTLGPNYVSFGYEGNDFMVSMSGRAECEIGEEYENGFKNANITDFGKRFGIECNEETMYYGDWVYRYPANAVEFSNAVRMYINELEKNGFEYTGTQDGRSSYSNGNIIVGTRTVDDSFYLSIVKK